MFKKFFKEMYELYFEPYEKKVQRERREDELASLKANVIMTLPKKFKMNERQELLWTLLHSGLIQSVDFAEARKDPLLKEAVEYYISLEDDFDNIDNHYPNGLDLINDLNDKINSLKPLSLQNLNASA